MIKKIAIPRREYVYLKNHKLKMPKRNSSDYWIGPAGVLVPNEIEEVPCLDKINIMYRPVFRNGVCTEMPADDIKPYTVRQYRKKYAHYHGGKWYWKIGDMILWGNHINYLMGYWKGPLDIMIPNVIPTVPGLGGGIHDRDQGMLFSDTRPITRKMEKEYRDRYAELHADGKWYWKSDSGIFN